MSFDFNLFDVCNQTAYRIDLMAAGSSFMPFDFNFVKV